MANQQEFSSGPDDANGSVFDKPDQTLDHLIENEDPIEKQVEQSDKQKPGESDSVRQSTYGSDSLDEKNEPLEAATISGRDEAASLLAEKLFDSTGPQIPDSEVAIDVSELVRLARCGDKTAQSLLFKSHSAYVHCCVRRIVHSPEDVEDIVQDAFLIAFASLDKLVTPSAFAPWLWKIARNKALKHVTGKRVSISNDDVALHSVDDPPDIVAVRRETASQVKAALDQLTKKQRQAVETRFSAGLSSAECARVLFLEKGAVRGLIFRAFQKLKILLRDLDPTQKDAPTKIRRERGEK